MPGAEKKEAKQNAKEEIKLAKEAEQEDADMLRAAKVEEGSVKEGENKYESSRVTSENLRGSIPHAAKSTHPRSYLHGCG